MKIYPKRNGFTLVELMIVVAIIGILAVVAVPKFADLIVKSRQAKAKHMLGALRGAISIYYGDVNEYPTDLAVALTSGEKYFSAIPTIDIPAVPAQNNPGHLSVTGVKNLAVADDDVGTGVFGYNQAGDSGHIFINCTHKDASGQQWTSY